mmetsp:Transcript_93456/g.264294  ORF Transcript_93456/g.264294 Transcript_93456/m.264294 type:complete len:319 (-) Transcript_93456:149-1105(-)
MRHLDNVQHHGDRHLPSERLVVVGTASLACAPNSKPRELHPALGWLVVEGLRGVGITEFHVMGLRLWHKLGAIECPNLVCASSGHEDPAGLVLASGHGQLKEVGAFKVARDIDFLQEPPLFHVLGGEDAECRVLQPKRHDPLLGRSMPVNLRVPRVVLAVPLRDNGAVEVLPSAALVCRVGHALGEPALPLWLVVGLVWVLVWPGPVCVESHDRLHAVTLARQATGIVKVHHGRTRPDVAHAVRRDGVLHLAPVEKVTADSVPPGHVRSPLQSPTVVLEEEVILPPVEDQTVWIVHPVLRRSEVELRAPSLLIQWLIV